MKQLGISILFLLHFILATNAQDIDKIKINKAEAVESKYLSCIQGQSYLLYNIDEYYLIFVREGGKFKQYFINETHGKIDSNLITKNGLLNEVFKRELSPCNFIYSIADSIHRFGNFTDIPKYSYFVLKNNGVKFIEFNLPVLFLPHNKNIDIYPISSRLRSYLLEKMYALTEGGIK